MKIIVSLCSLIISITAFGQNKIISIPYLLERVTTGYPAIKAKEASVRSAAYKLQSAKVNYLPDLIVADQYQYSTNNGLQGSYFSNGGTAISTSGGVRDKNIFTPVFGSFTTLMVDWQAFNFGKVKQSVAFARSQVDLAKADYNNEIFQLQIRAIDAYLLVVLSQKLVSVQQENLERSKTFQTYVQSHALSGLLPGVDSSASNAEVAQAQLSLLQSRQAVQQQKIQLSLLSNIPVDSLNVDTTTFLNSIPSVTPDTGFNNHPIIVFYRQLLQSNLERSFVVKKSSSPTIHLLGIGWARGSGINRASNDYSTSFSDGIPYQAYNYMAAVSINWNLVSLIKTKYDYRAAMQDVDNYRYQLQEQTLTLQKQVEDANLQYAYAVQQLQLAPVQYKAALDAYNLSNARYQAGLAPLTELIQAFTVLNRASVDVSVANNNLWRSLLQKTASSGIINIFIKQIPK